MVGSSGGDHRTGWGIAFPGAMLARPWDAGALT